MKTVIKKTDKNGACDYIFDEFPVEGYALKKFKIKILDQDVLDRCVTDFCDAHYDLEASFWQGPGGHDRIEFLEFLSKSIIENGVNVYHKHIGYLKINGDSFPFGEREGKVSVAVDIITFNDEIFIKPSGKGYNCGEDEK